MNIEFEVADVIPAPPDVVYAAWLDSDEHTQMTGGQAVVSTKVGEPFEALGWVHSRDESGIGAWQAGPSTLENLGV